MVDLLILLASPTPIDSVADGITITVVIAIIGAIGLFFERFSNWRVNRILAKKAPGDAAATVATAATSMASAVDDLLVPLREEVKASREESRHLRDEIEKQREEIERHRSESNDLHEKVGALQETIRLLTDEVHALRSKLDSHGIPYNVGEPLTLKESAEVANQALERGLQKDAEVKHQAQQFQVHPFE